ncbi:hypothetical protein [Candidatus Aquiluna sp. UB-MaderosW2red]|uniref:hypothetical protein n=1 Tax=Candidatus Aquiluna sp. UB-MaderosW2red TaxID=1855377 RepID=UPI000875C1D1|nr:hypothetical protein [Candidatus Aquiluna sp. UB-MaderosW2red]SCX02368.1 hypothetical protein SAMN05216534_0005 [Candidatus Aquiluna sp. UB-MaderosW2red]
MAKLTAARLRKSQIAMLATFIFMGHAALSSVAWVPEYIDRLGVSFAEWGTIIGFGIIGSIAPLFFASRLIMRFSSRMIIRWGIYGGMVMLVLLGLSTEPAIWFFINMGFNFFMSLVGVAVNSHAVLIQKQIKINVMGRFHAGWAVGAVAAAISGGLSTVFLSLEVFLVAVAIITLVVFEFCYRWLLNGQEDGHIEEKALVVKRKFYQFPPQLALLALGMFFGVFPEVVIIDWAAVFARDILNLDLALRSIPFATFMSGMIIGRLSLTRWAKRFPPNLIASRGAFIAAGAFAVTALVAAPLAAINQYLGLAVSGALWLIAGLGLSSLAPVFSSAAGHIPGVSTSWALSSISLFSSSVTVLAKTLMGALAQGVGLPLAFFFPITLAIGAGFIAATFAKQARRSELADAAPPTGPISVIIVDEEGRA